MELKDLRLLGLNFTKVFYEKNPSFSGQLAINQNINIDSIEKYKPEIAKQDTLKITFGFDVDYGEMGKIELKGMMFLSLDEKSIEEVLKEWENKKLPKEFNLVVLNVIFQKASLKALQLEEELGLPPHVQLPRFQLEPSKTEADEKQDSKESK